MGAPFSEVARRMAERFLSWDPALATQLGWHNYDAILRDPSRKALEGQAAKLREFISTLSGYSDDELSEDERIDRDLGIHLFKLKLFEITDLRMYERVSTACEEIGLSLLFLFSRNVPPFEERMQGIVSRLERVPGFLERSKGTLKDPYRLWNEIALESGEALPLLLEEINGVISESLLEPDFKSRAADAVSRASASIRAYNAWLRDEVLPVASHRFTLTPSEYETYLGMKGYDVTMGETLEIGRIYLKIVQKGMEEASRDIVPSGAVDAALDAMRANHPPTFAEALGEYKRSADRARAFVREMRLATIPSGERLVMMETPKFMRKVAPLAAQFEPGKYDGSDEGLFMLTPDESSLELLHEHNYAAIGNTAVHEAYPGHHLQGICCNRNPSRLRAIVSSPDFSEGWALYCEDLMLSEGYNDTPLGRLASLNDLMFRLCRQVSEIELPRGGMTLDEATDMLHALCHMESNAARAEMTACAMNPTYYIAYFLGELAILQLRDELKAALGKKFTLGFFHDALLYAGCMPMQFMRRAVSMKVRQEYGIELGPPRESLYRYAMRRARGR